MCPNKGCVLFVPKLTLNDHLKCCPWSNVTCPFPGCEKQITRQILYDHLLECGFRQLELSCKSCGEPFKIHEQEEHEQVCQQTIVTCPNDGCGINMKRYVLLQHVNFCKYKIVECPYSHLGCIAYDRNVKIRKHKKQCPFRPVECKICGRGMLYKDYEVHSRGCNCFIFCQDCGQKVRRSAVRIHKFICPKHTYKIVCYICHQLYDSCDMLLHNSHDIIPLRSNPQGQTTRTPTSSTCGLPESNEETSEPRVVCSKKQVISVNDPIEVQQNITVIDKDIRTGHMIQGLPRKIWKHGGYATGRKKFERLLNAVDKKLYTYDTASVKQTYSYGCKKYNADYNYVEQFR